MPVLPVLLLSARVLCSTSQPWWPPAPCSLLHDQQWSAAPSLLLLASGCSREQELPGRPAHPQRPFFFMAASSIPPSWRFPPMDNVPPLRSRLDVVVEPSLLRLAPSMFLGRSIKCLTEQLVLGSPFAMSSTPLAVNAIRRARVFEARPVG
ncbi:hypothetical protein Zm00014a_011355 [Zea mays]|uniref:Secreted protein n=1 Tax=Zea mays TaxID=4577 RepID=A0A3L6F737_MAIZE|nr:hypothetical protein Zm00014a_011355 [Zea mays]